MTVQQAKQELIDYRHNAEEIRCRREEIRKLESRLYSGTSGSMEDGVIALVTLKEYYCSIVERLVTKRISIEQKISCLPQPYRNVLYLYYLRNYSMVRIAAQLHYDCTYVSKLHSKALALYAETWAEKIA